jgi:hypothetical protein
MAELFYQPGIRKLRIPAAMTTISVGGAGRRHQSQRGRND